MSAAVTTARNRPKEYEVTVSEVRLETHDTATLSLDFGPERPEYKAGQFLNLDPHQFPALGRFAAYLQEHKGRKEPARSYSLASAPHEPLVAITVKDEDYIPGFTRYPPLLSPYLVHAPLTGSRMKVLGFMGPYVLPDDVEERTDHLVHVVAGSGAVPNFSIIKDALHRGLKPRHTVICSNKTWGDILYREAFEALERAHPDKLRVVHTLTREMDESRFSAAVRKGRISEALLEELIPDRATCLVYVCGPAITPWDRRKALETRTPATPRFMEAVLGHLHTIGLEDKRIKRESYG
ncbi:ferredoxin-NADP reductase [Archangium gephyra]|uniref:Ferredoxin-NADP reductase n=1 Tax=Archangium gephyra TaxID=48 RepID=A0AAC8QHC7_9BACT|nr:oxidoreductase [Archangium gephyra]AKJ07071.1 oxidoreductase FAD/NAD(P)-binding domain protein [Archangium gephyra]REG26486.1 ferredoxin-NADP reductase [Archangium gephyra]